MGALLLALARIVRVVTYLAALVIVVAIVLRVAGANPANAIVRDIHDVGKALVGPFHNVFTIKNPKASIAVNWGLAAVVWVVVGSVISSLLVRIAPRRL